MCTYWLSLEFLTASHSRPQQVDYALHLQKSRASVSMSVHTKLSTVFCLYTLPQ